MKPHRFLLGLSLAALASFTGSRATELYLYDYSSINLDSLGASRYDVYGWVNMSSDSSMQATADFLGASYSISGNYDVYLTLDYINIRKVGSTWTAETVIVYDTFGNPSYYSNVPMSSSGYVRIYMIDTSTWEYLMSGMFTVTYNNGTALRSRAMPSRRIASVLSATSNLSESRFTDQQRSESTWQSFHLNRWAINAATRRESRNAARRYRL